MGTSNEDLLRTIRYYQDSLEKYSSNGNNYKVLSAIKKLKCLPIATSHLEDTGIGRTVNSLRKLGGEVGDAAKALVSSWKEMVLQEDVKKDEADNDVSEEYENNDGRTSDETEIMDAKYRHKEKSSSHKSSDDIKSEKERYNTEKKYNQGNIRVSADKKDNRDRDSNRYKYEHTSSSEKYKSKEKNVDSDSNSESESENDDSEHTKSDSQYGSDSESDDEGNGSSDAGKIGEKYRKDVNRSSGSKSHEGKKHKYNNNDERHNSKRKHHSDSSESDDDGKNGNGYKSKSHINESDEEGKRKVDKSSSSRSSHGKKDSRDKEKSAKKHKHGHDDTTKRHGSKRKYESVSNSESDEEEKNCKKKHSRSDRKHTSDSEEDDDEEVNERKIKHSSESTDYRKDHRKSQVSRSDRHEASSSNSKSGEKTESKTRESSSSSSKGKSSSKSKSSKKEDSEDRSSSKHKSKGGHNSSEAEERSRSKHERDSKDSKTHSSHSSRHDRKDKDISKDKHSHKKEESKRHEEKERNSKSERDGGKKEKSSGSSSSKSKSSGSKHKSTSEKSSKAKDEPKRKTVIVNGIDSESGASFAEALGMCGPMSFSKVASGSKKKSSSQSSPDKHSKSVPPSTSTKTEKPERTEEKYVPNLLKEQPPEPLALNISSLLPEISPNYKPVAFPLDSHPKKYMTADEALSQAISNKNLRTKVYSGNKIKGGDVDSLFTLCVRVLQDNLDAMECTGGVPYHILKPILEKATPDQLFNLEHYNPYLIEETDELWRLHCMKEFRTKKREEMETWREMYMRCLDEREAKLNFIKANIKESQDKSLPVRTTKLAYVDSVAKPPRNIARKQAKNGIVVSKVPVKTPSARLSVLATSGEASKVSVPNPGSRAVDRSSSGSSSAIKPKKAPLMAKTLSLFKNRFKR